MSIKVKQAITRSLIQIENETFDEDTIRTLLISSREYLKNEGLIKELAHFIAHPVRNQGMFHKKVNNRYTKMKLVNDHISKFKLDDLKVKIKTEDELSDFMLGGIDIDKIEAKIFKILYSDGLDDLPESHLIKYTGLKKTEIKKIFEDNYRKKNGYYYLTTNTTENLITAFKCLPISKYDPEKDTDIAEQLLLAEKLINKTKSGIDAIQKVIRGAIYFNSVFETDVLYNEIESAISEVINEFSIDKKYISHVKKNRKDILLCIMTLLHDSSFCFYDNNVARTFLCFNHNYDVGEAQKINYNLHETIYNKGVVALYISYKTGSKQMTLPLFISELSVSNYLPVEIYDGNRPNTTLSEIVWTTASRINTKLQLTDTME